MVVDQSVLIIMIIMNISVSRSPPPVQLGGMHSHRTAFTQPLAGHFAFLRIITCSHPAAALAPTSWRPHLSCAASGASDAPWRWGSAMVIIRLSQLPLEAEGYRHIVCLIDNYASSENVLTKKCGWGSDSGIALKQTCRAVHAWYHWTAEERGLVLHETSSEDGE